LPEALAEYRLSLAQGGDGVDGFLRVAHAYASSGRVIEARDYYQQAVDIEPELAGLAASDLLRVAKMAIGSQDEIAAAAAVEAAMELIPGVSLTGISLPLARHFTRNGQYGRALPFFQKALRETDSDPDVIFQMAFTHEELGDCRRALVFFEQIREEVTPAQRSEVDWNIGNCSVELATEAKAEEDLDEALRLFQTTIELGEPRNRLAEAWFEIGEILASQGECSAAVAAFDQVSSQDLPGGFIVGRARARADDIRFFRRGGEAPC
jgi:tetratricopeptide (TPR) repeat protein